MESAARQRAAGDQMNDLLAAVADNRDRTAFQVVFEAFAPRLKAFMRRQGTDRDMAEEVVQETMVKVWRKAAQFDPLKASVSTWIFTIARNSRIDLLREANRPAPDMNDPAFVPDPEPHAHQKLSREQEARHLKEAVAGLPPEQQEVCRGTKVLENCEEVRSGAKSCDEALLFNGLRRGDGRMAERKKSLRIRRSRGVNGPENAIFQPLQGA